MWDFVVKWLCFFFFFFFFQKCYLFQCYYMGLSLDVFGKYRKDEEGRSGGSQVPCGDGDNL